MSRRTPYTFEEPQEDALEVWRSLEEKDADPIELRKKAEAEFPEGVRESILDASSLLSRRKFMTVASAAAAVAGLGGCIRRPEEHIVPFTRGPEYVQPGVPLHFATVMNRRGEALGLLVVSNEGRPTKIEGNPLHPSSLGGTDVIAQASILDLYDPDRSKSPLQRGDGGRSTAVSYGAFDRALREIAAQAGTGEGLRVLLPPTNSPSVVRLRTAVRTRFPAARFHTYASIHDANATQGARLAFGQPVHEIVDFSGARVVVSIDSDFLGGEPGAVRASKGYARSRAVQSPRDAMSRLYVAESVFSVTGLNADHRLRLSASEMEGYLLALARELVERQGVDVGALGTVVRNAPRGGFPETWLRAVASDLAQNRGRAIILVGSRQPPRVHALAHVLNRALAATAPFVTHVPVTDTDQGADPQQPGRFVSPTEDIQALAADIHAGRVRTLLMLGGNPVYDAPSDVRFADALAKEGLTSIHLSTHVNETSSRSTWHVPEAHELESWGDQRALDGTVALQQPLIAPLWGGKSKLEILAVLAGERSVRGYDIVRSTTRATTESLMFERDWRLALQAGLIPGTAPGALPELPLQVDAIVQDYARIPVRAARPGRDNLEVVFDTDSHLADGRHANNPWLLELPHPVSKVTWDNTAMISPKTARELGVSNGDVIRLGKEGAREIEIVAWILPGQPDYTITLPLGWGRSDPGRDGKGTGFDVQPLRTTGGFDFASGVRLTRAGRTYPLSQTQEHNSMEGRPAAIEGVLTKIATQHPVYSKMPAYSETPNFAEYRAVDATTGPLWKQVDYSKNARWGMTIDLSACTGCEACMVACQAENNIPAVGKDQVARNREMYWIRVDRYFLGNDEAEPLVSVQPVACVHCEEAPCENVCPVNATTHSPEGLNEMTYNRCVGTRYCANNCPYKVRRFNYLAWHDRRYENGVPEVRKMQFNPNVTVRMRGVMEKCTYCVQRIESAKIAAKRTDRAIRDGEITPACAQACPSDAIVFGDLNNEESRVARMAATDRRYKLLAEIGTQPRTTYLARIRNPNPAMLGASAGQAIREHATEKQG